MDKDIYSTLADSRPLIALIYKIYAKNTIYKKRQLCWLLVLYPVHQLTAVAPLQEQTITNRYKRGKWKTSVFVKQMF